MGKVSTLDYEAVERRWKEGAKLAELIEETGRSRNVVERALRNLGLLPPPIPRSSKGQTSNVAPEDVVRVRDRDPCFKCGVRGDVGCQHRPAASGQALVG